MGSIGTMVVFGAGYAAGMRFGDRPLVMVRDAVGQGRDKAANLMSGAQSTIRSTLGDDGRTVREAMTSPAEVASPDTTLADVARTMERSDIGDVLIVDESHRVIGIVTDRDLAIRGLAGGLEPEGTAVREVMTPVVETIEPSATAAEALERMRRRDVRRLPVIEDGMPVGVVSLGDLSTNGRAGLALADISAAPPDH